MGQLETNLKNKHDATLTRWQRLLRCNTGSAWGGEFIKPSDSFRVFGFKINFPVLKNLRKIELCPTGTSDQVGFDSVVITPDMVGKRVAVFVACEIKAGKDRLRPAQKNFKKLVVNMGGIHKEIRDNKVIESGFISSIK